MKLTVFVLLLGKRRRLFWNVIILCSYKIIKEIHLGGVPRLKWGNSSKRSTRRGEQQIVLRNIVILGGMSLVGDSGAIRVMGNGTSAFLLGEGRRGL